MSVNSHSPQTPIRTTRTLAFSSLSPPTTPDTPGQQTAAAVQALNFNFSPQSPPRVLRAPAFSSFSPPNKPDFSGRQTAAAVQALNFNFSPQSPPRVLRAPAFSSFSPPNKPDFSKRPAAAAMQASNFNLSPQSPPRVIRPQAFTSLSPTNTGRPSVHQTAEAVQTVNFHLSSLSLLGSSCSSSSSQPLAQTPPRLQSSLFPMVSPEIPPKPSFNQTDYPETSPVSPLPKRRLTADWKDSTSPNVQRVKKQRDETLKPYSSPARGYVRPTYTTPATPCLNRTNSKLPLSLADRRKAERVLKTRDYCDQISFGLPLIGVGRFHKAFAFGTRGILKIPNDREFANSAGKTLIYERMEYAKKNYETLLTAKQDGLLPDLHVLPTTFDYENATIQQQRCTHLLTKEDLNRPDIVAKLARTFLSAYIYNIPLDLKRDNLALENLRAPGRESEEQVEMLVIFDSLEADVGSFRVRTPSLLKDTAEKNEDLFKALDPRPLLKAVLKIEDAGEKGESDLDLALKTIPPRSLHKMVDDFQKQQALDAKRRKSS